MALIFVTSNSHKFGEVREIAARRGINVARKNIRYAEIQADELEEIALLSVSEVCDQLQTPCFVEDAGLFVSALRGFPGPYSNYVFRTIGNRGLLKLMTREEDRRAEFRSAVGFCAPGKKPKIFLGKAIGAIANSEKGNMGFGFDPIFIHQDGGGRTFAELSRLEKNALSHRARAIGSFFNWFV